MSQPDNDTPTLQLEPFYGVYLLDDQSVSKDDESQTADDEADEDADDEPDEDSDAESTSVEVELDFVRHSSGYLVLYDGPEDIDAEPPRTKPSALISSFKQIFKNEIFENEQERLLAAKGGYPELCRKTRVLVYPWALPPGALLEVEKIICSGPEGSVLVYLEDGTVIEESPSRNPNADSSSSSHPECRIFKFDRQE